VRAKMLTVNRISPEQKGHTFIWCSQQEVEKVCDWHLQ
jgi:hypothetical protein